MDRLLMEEMVLSSSPKSHTQLLALAVQIMSASDLDVLIKNLPRLETSNASK